jgi:hypothetical protein
MLGDTVKDWVSGQEYVVSWDGSTELQFYDARLTVNVQVRRTT